MGNLADDAGKLLQEAERAHRAIARGDWAAARTALEAIKWLDFDAMIAEAQARHGARETAERRKDEGEAIARAWRRGRKSKG